MANPISMVALKSNKATVTAEQSQKLMNARCRLMTRHPWYGHIAMSMVWIPSNMPWLPEHSRTMGVRIVNGGEIQCLYYPPFVDSMDLRELFAVIQHEIEHIVRCHCTRAGSRNPEQWNIAVDMTVNGTRNNPRIGYRDASSSEVIVPLQGNIVWIPENWENDQTSEFYYDKLGKEQKGPSCGNCGRPMPDDKKGPKGKGPKGKGKGKKGKKDKGEGEGEGQGEGQDDQGQGGGGATCTDDSCPTCGQDSQNGYSFGGVSGQAIDDHSTWNQTDVSPDEMRQVVKDVVDQATEKTRGEAPGHLADAIAQLNKPVVRWREIMRAYLGRHVGNRRLTYSRRNRRINRFGVKGVSKHAAATVNVIIDTSGSVSKNELEQFFAEIDTLASRAKVYVLQWDHAFQGYKQYRRGDWKKFEVRGRGGTNMADPIYWLRDNGLVADVQVLLTDGYTPWADKQPFPMINCITSPEASITPPDWGHVVWLDINR